MTLKGKKNHYNIKLLYEDRITSENEIRILF